MSFHSGSLWYPYTPLTDYQKNPPIEIIRADGVFLYDQNGKSYLDGIASWWCCHFGHRHPQIVAAIKKQLDSLIHVSLAGLTHPGAKALSEKLVQLTPPGLDHVFFSDNGSTAIEAALKICLQRWQLKGETKKKIFVGFESGYHGDTLGAMAVGGSEVFHKWFKPWFPETIQLPSPSTPETCVRAFKSLIQERKDEIAGVVIEPLLQAAGGMLISSPETLSQISELCQEIKVPLIADEIAVGLGRSGSLWAVDQSGVVPDILCTSKGLTGGTLPLAATVVHSDLIDEFVDRGDEQDRTFYHGHTYTGNPVACAAALAALELVCEPEFLNHIACLGNAVKEEIVKFESLEGVQIRSLGPVGVVETSLQGTRPLLPVYRNLLNDGIYLRPLGNLFYFWPPLITPEDEMRSLINKTFFHLKNHLQ